MIYLIFILLAGCLTQTQVPDDTSTLTQLNLHNNDKVSFIITEVNKKIGDLTLRMLAFNGTTPGPTLHVKQGEEIEVNIKNSLNEDTIIHWHGVIPYNKYDGSPVTQNTIDPGENFTYRVPFDYPGLYWYHAHVHGESQIERGLFGTILVEPKDPNYYISYNKTEIMAVHDMLIVNNDIYQGTNRHMKFMGRYGNYLLINGKTDYTYKTKKGEITRLMIVNTANSRIFNLYFGGLKFLVFGSDLGRFQKPFYATNISLGPGERYTIYLQPQQEGTYQISHLTSRGAKPMGKIIVEGSVENPPLPQDLDYTSDYNEILENWDYWLNKAPDFENYLVANMRGSDVWKIVNKNGTPVDLKHPLKVKTGQWFKLRIINPVSMMHSFPHPMHIHGAKMLLIKLNGVPNKNLVWKDTVIVPPRGDAEILVKFEKPGDWLYHCHIIEHLSSGMVGYFEVT